MSHKFTRLELYELAWSEPLRKLGQRMGISDVAIAKHCRRANIPLPGIGYWAKKEAGKLVLPPPFPPRGLGQSDDVTIGGKNRYSWAPQESDEEMLAATITPPPPFPEAMRLRAIAWSGERLSRARRRSLPRRAQPMPSTHAGGSIYRTT